MAITIYYVALLIYSDFWRENDAFFFNFFLIKHVNRSMNFLHQRH